jgi:hypothetical protein
MDVLVPALVFAAMAGIGLRSARPTRRWRWAGLLVLATCGLLAWPVARLCGIRRRSWCRLCCSTIPATSACRSRCWPGAKQALPAAVILFMVENTLHYPSAPGARPEHAGC